MASPLKIKAFEQARDRVWEKLTVKKKEQAGRGMLGNMNKIRPYLDGLNRYGDVIAVFVSVKPDILGLIWGPIKLLLQVRHLPQLWVLALFTGDSWLGSNQIANYLGLFYTEIIEFHYQALRIFRQTRWRALFEVLWPRYEEIFTAIHRNIEKHKGLINRQVKILTIMEARQENQEALKRYQEERDFRELCKLEKNIFHFDYTPRLYDLQSRYCANTGERILSDDRFRVWLDASLNEVKVKHFSAILYCSIFRERHRPTDQLVCFMPFRPTITLAETHRQPLRVRLYISFVRQILPLSSRRIKIASHKEIDIRWELEKHREIVIVEEKNRADIKRFITGKINTLWNEIKHVAEPRASDFFKEVARDIVVRSGGDKKLQHNRAPYKDFLALCGPIMEKRNEYLTFVHFSAKGVPQMTLVSPLQFLLENSLKQGGIPRSNQDSQIPSNSSTLGQLQSKYPEEYRKLSIITAHLETSRITGNSEELFRCPVISCSRHRRGFETRAKRDCHVAKHQRLVKCDVANCDFNSIGFGSEADKADHMSKRHEISSDQQVEDTWDDMNGNACFRVLCSAAREGESEIVQSLLSLLILRIPKQEGFGKLLRAAGEGKSADVIDLVCKTALRFVGSNDVKKELEDELYRAIVSRSKEFVRALCHNSFCTVMGLNAASSKAVSAKGYKFPSGFVPVHLAMLRQLAAIVEPLLEAGANVDVVSWPNGDRALHMAAREGNEAMVRLLLDYGAKLETETTFNRKYYRCTALHVAILGAQEGIA
ncbi:hypothetical protein BDD12DRAFT_946276 [Trichophaea hybrida]|nr:hypothetical protein BDD12DRAFT_946276 [Trichophaea hybrida]